MGNSECAAKNDDQAATKAATAACNTSGSNKECATDTTTDTPVTDATVEPAGTGLKTNPATDILVATTLAVPITYAQTGVKIAASATNIAAPIIESFTDIKNVLNKLFNEDETKQINSLEKFQNKTFEEACNLILQKASNESKKTPLDIIAIFENANTEIKTLYTTLLQKQKQKGGGKKIISRTHKSINQFLNPKITAANIKSKRFRNTKSKSKYKSKKRTRY
jgi:hypothetical protein